MKRALREREGRRASIVGLVMVAAAAFGPAAAAHASTAHVSGTELVYNADGGDANDATVVLAGASYTIQDSGSTINPNNGCTPVGPSEVTCPAAGVTRVRVQLNNGDDRLTLHGLVPGTLMGGPGNDTLVGGGGDDLMNGGPGNDSLDGGVGLDWLVGEAGDDALAARDGLADALGCGDGTDTAVVDALDGSPADCESVDAPFVEWAPEVVAPSEPIAVGRAGVVPLRLRCDRSMSGRCEGVLTLLRRPLRRTVSAARRRSALVLGRARYSIVRGGAVTLRLRLNLSARRLLARRGEVNAVAQVARRGAPNLRNGQNVRLRRRSGTA